MYLQKESCGYSYIIFPLLILIFTSCGHRKEYELFHQCRSRENPRERVGCLQQFIADYPKNDSLSSALAEVLVTLSEQLDQTDEAVRYAATLMLNHPDPGLRRIAYNFMFRQVEDDTGQIGQQVEDALQAIPNSTARATLYRRLIRFYCLYQCSDSLRSAELSHYVDQLLMTGFSDSETHLQLAQGILQSDGGSGLIPIANRLLFRGIECNRKEHIRFYKKLTDPDKLQEYQKGLYQQLYIQLAWNAYRQDHYLYALNLISQAGKFGNLADNNGLIVLGAALAKSGETDEAWKYILRGLTLNPGAETESAEIMAIYTDVFHQIHGRQRNPQQFLDRYRRFHQP